MDTFDFPADDGVEVMTDEGITLRVILDEAQFRHTVSGGSGDDQWTFDDLDFPLAQEIITHVRIGGVWMEAVESLGTGLLCSLERALCFDAMGDPNDDSGWDSIAERQAETRSHLGRYFHELTRY